MKNYHEKYAQIKEIIILKSLKKYVSQGFILYAAIVWMTLSKR